MIHRIACQGPSSPESGGDEPATLHPPFGRRALLGSLGGLGVAMAGSSTSAFSSLGTRARSLRVVEGRIGDIQVARVYETITRTKVSSWFPGVDAKLLRPYLDWLVPLHYDPATDTFPMLIQSWVLRSGSRTILIDTCFGNDKDRPGYGYADHLRTPYLDRLRAVGVAPEDVDIVLCTHLHLDHCGWNTRLENGRWVPTFPNAKYIWSRLDQDDSLQQMTDQRALPFARTVYADSVAPVIAAGQARAVDGVFAVDDNILLRPAPGHSPGSLRIEVTSRGKTGVFSGDILHSALQIPLWQYGSVIDFDRREATEARHALLAFCADNDALLLPAHFPAPYVARIVRNGDSFAMQPGWG